MAKPQKAAASMVPIKVSASTKNPKDKGYQHCFEQNPKSILTFKVKTDPSVDHISIVLWNMNNPVKPYIAEPSRDWPVRNGRVTIKIGPDRPHLGPGPYCATLTASSPTAASAASKGGRKIVGNAIYYYDTWKDSRPYTWPV